jgi:hypothetical protein
VTPLVLAPGPYTIGLEHQGIPESIFLLKLERPNGNKDNASTYQPSNSLKQEASMAKNIPLPITLVPNLPT